MDPTPKEITEKCNKSASEDTELDAIHPRFLEAQDPEEIRQYEIYNHYFCEECDLFIAPTYKGLKIHFNGEMVQHKPYASCFYCRGVVFQYRFRRQRQVYHNCRDNRNSKKKT